MAHEPLSVAIIGASGIGKHHAKWHQIAGSRVVAFLGSSPESCAPTAEAMKKLFGFDGRAYHDIDRMLDEEQIDAVSVCSPDALHGPHALKALERGIHVLCEKPLVWPANTSHDEILAAGERVVAAAEERSLVLAINTQYATALPFYYELHRRHRGEPARPETFYCATTSVIRKPVGSAESIWQDLGSHPISLLLAALPGGQLDEASVDCTVGPMGTVAEFDWTLPEGPCRCHLVVGKTSDDEMERSFGINRFIVHYTGRNDANGQFKTYLQADGSDEEHEYPDLMLSNIEAFIAAVRGEGQVVADGRTALSNLALQLRLLELAAKGCAARGDRNSKSQAPNLKQAPISEAPMIETCPDPTAALRATRLGIRIWIIWICLIFGIWCLVLRPRCPVPGTSPSPGAGFLFLRAAGHRV